MPAILNKRTILNKESAASIIQRIRQLNESAAAHWSSLCAAGMMHHCAVVNEAIAEAAVSGKKPGIRQIALRVLVLDIMRKMPKRGKR